MSISNQGSRVDYLSELAQRLVDLEAAAYEEFALLFGPQLFRYFRRHGLSEFEATDLAATCVTDIALKANKYRSDAGSFSSWTFAVAKNALIDLAKRSKRVSDAIAEMRWEMQGASSVDPDVVVEVNAALAELSEIDRTLIQRRILGGEHSFKELAEELGLTEGNARVRHLRALERLEARLAASPTIQSRLGTDANG